MRRFPGPGSIRRVVIVVPSLFTLFNLFFGIWSMVLASRGEFYRAGWYIFFAGVLDALDGRVARLSRTGTRFGGGGTGGALMGLIHPFGSPQQLTVDDLTSALRR